MYDPWGLEGATVAITGASTGIGAALTDAFLDSKVDRGFRKNGAGRCVQRAGW